MQKFVAAAIGAASLLSLPALAQTTTTNKPASGVPGSTAEGSTTTGSATTGTKTAESAKMGAEQSAPATSDTTENGSQAAESAKMTAPNPEAKNVSSAPSGSSDQDKRAAAAAESGSSAGTMKVRQKIVQDLQQEGFHNIHVAAGSFLVHAQNKQGESVVMIIHPDSVFSMTDVGGNSSTASKTASTAQ